jgi:hypothetical protein
MLQTFAEALISADADAVCGTGYGQRNPDRTNTPNGYRRRGWDTRAASIDLAIPKLRGGKLLPRLAVGAAPTGRVRSRVGGSGASRHGGWRSWSKPSASPG